MAGFTIARFPSVSWKQESSFLINYLQFLGIYFEYVMSTHMNILCLKIRLLSFSVCLIFVLMFMGASHTKDISSPSLTAVYFSMEWRNKKEQQNLRKSLLQPDLWWHSSPSNALLFTLPAILSSSFCYLLYSVSLLILFLPSSRLQASCQGSM